ncbi:MAG: hypothetical protein ABIR14_02535 [Candidatus Paceibacterota bacterium]
MDNKKNGTETGIDCGGSCSLACADQVDSISILWARSFRVVPGRYNAVAYVENHNKNAALKKINYRFRFADANNVYIAKREGSAHIPAGGKFAIFEPAVDTGNSTPVYTTFEFTENPSWTQVPQAKLEELKLTVSDIGLVNEDTNPVLSAKIKNNSFYSVPEIGVVVILYDVKNNAVSASKTFIDELQGGEKRDINFTWPEPFVGNIVAKEVIPMFDISQVKFK